MKINNSNDNRKSLLSSIIIYGLSSGTGIIVTLIVFPLILRVLTPEQTGVMAIVDVACQFLAFVLLLGLDTALLRFLPEQTPDQQKSCISSIIFFLVCTTGLFLFLVFSYNKEFSFMLFGKDSYALYLKIASSYLSFSIFNQLLLKYLRYRDMSKSFTTIKISSILIRLGITLWILIMYNQGLEAFFYGRLCGEAVIFICFLRVFIPLLKFNFSFSIVKGLLRFSVPVCFTSIAAILLNMGDRFIINLRLDISAVGKYFLVYKIFSSSYLLVATAFQMAVIPDAYKSYKSGNAPKRFAGYSYKMCLFSGYVLLGSGLFFKEILIFLKKSALFGTLTDIGLLLLPVFLLKAWAEFPRIAFHISKKTEYPAIIVFVAAAMNVTGNLLLIPWLGLKGAALSSTLSFIFIGICYFYKAQKLYYIPYRYVKTGLWNFFVIFVVAGVWYFESLGQYGILDEFKADLVSLNPEWLHIIFKCLVMAVLPFLIFDMKDICSRLYCSIKGRF